MILNLPVEIKLDENDGAGNDDIVLLPLLK